MAIIAGDDARLFWLDDSGQSNADVTPLITKHYFSSKRAHSRFHSLSTPPGPSTHSCTSPQSTCLEFANDEHIHCRQADLAESGIKRVPANSKYARITESSSEANASHSIPPSLVNILPDRDRRQNDGMLGLNPALSVF